MIDPVNFTHYKLNKYQLEEYILFSICVAGKNALTTAKALDKFLHEAHKISECAWPRHFQALRQIPNIPILLRLNGIGCYNSKGRSIRELISGNINLHTCSTDELEEIYGIGPKTSRFFILHTRPNVRLACLDTHILRYMGDRGIIVPKSTPTGSKYKKLEQQFIELADKAGKDIAEFDLNIWREYSGNKV